MKIIVNQLKVSISCILLILIACNNQKNYGYVEIQRGSDSAFTSKRETYHLFKAESDSAAYLEAYLNYCSARKVFENMKQNGEATNLSPISFKLLDDQGAELTVFFPDKSKREKEIERIFGLGDTTQESFKKGRDKK